MNITKQDLYNAIIDVKNFPKKGVIFKDITPILADVDLFSYCINQLFMISKNYKFDYIISPESRGFLFGPTISYLSNAGFILARKPNRLPRSTYEDSYDLEYNTQKLQIHKDDIKPNSKILVVDDLIATGGSSQAIINLVHKTRSEVVAIICMINLKYIKKNNYLKKYPIHYILEYN